MKEIPLTEALFSGHVSIERTPEGWLKPWRANHTKLKLFPSREDERLLKCFEKPAGVRLRIRTDSKTIKLDVQLQEKSDNCRFDMVLDNKIQESIRAEEVDNDITFNNLPNGVKVVEIWLAHTMPVNIKSIQIDDDCYAEPAGDQRLKWITYGSSITQCGSAHSPSRTWPAIVARRYNLNLTCLGYGGNCMLEPMVARMIRDLPADLITLKVGINILGGSAYSFRTFKAALIGFIQIIREKHQEIPIGVMSAIIHPRYEEQMNGEFNHLKMRAEVADGVEHIKEVEADNNLFYMSGLELFAEDLVELRMPDQLHPDGDGCEILGKNIGDKFMPSLLSRVC